MQYEGAQSSVSKSANSVSSRHCSCARSLDVRNSTQARDGFGEPVASRAQASVRRNVPGCQRLAPGRKLCSRLFRAIALSSRYPRP